MNDPLSLCDPYRQFFEHQPSAVSFLTLVLDADNQPQDCIFDQVNHGFERITGLSRQLLLGRSVLSVFPASKPAWVERCLQVGLTGVPTQFECFWEDQHTWYQVAAFQHKVNGFTACFTDISAFVEIARLAAVGSMTTSLNHEFGNLISTLSTQFLLVEMMMPDDEASRSLARKIRNQFQRSQRLIDSIKRLAKGLELAKERCRLSEIAGDVVEVSSPYCKEKQIKLEFAPAEADWVEVDVALTQQVLLNLFQSCAHRVLGRPEARIRVTIQVENGEVLVRVGGGPAVPAEIRETILTSSFPAPAELSPGSPYGLSFCAAAVERQGGVLVLETGPDLVYQARFKVSFALTVESSQRP